MWGRGQPTAPARFAESKTAAADPRLFGALPIDGDDERPKRRYMETRWCYPRAGDGPIVDPTRLKRQVVFALPDRADHRPLHTNSSRFEAPVDRPSRLRCHLMRVFVMSFAYRRRLPRDAELIFDMRFLDNPHGVRKLRPQTRIAPGSMRGNPT